MNESQLTVALEKRYGGEAWAFLPQVRNGTGFQRKVDRTADAIAMSLWPSRGLEIHGFEIKCYRGDWVKELKQPEKAEEICRFCDRWWIVAGDDNIVRDGELPPTWGLLVADGDKLKVKVEAPTLTPQPLDKLFLAAILRKAKERVVPQAETKEKLADEYAKGQKRGEESAKIDIQRLEMELKHYKDSVTEFEAKAGVRIIGWNAGNIGDAVNFVRGGGVEKIQRGIPDLLATAKGIVAYLEKVATMPVMEAPKNTA